MKKWILGVMVLATMSSAYAVEYNLNLDIKVQSNEFYKIEKTTGKFYRVYSLVNGNTHLLVKANDQVVADANEPTSQRMDENEEYSIQPLDKNTIRLIDRTIVNGKRLDIDVIVKAQIEKSITGKVKSIKVASDEILAIYHDVLDEMGLSSLNSLNIQTEEAEIATNSSMKGIECNVEKESMTCDTGLDISMRIKFQED